MPPTPSKSFRLLVFRRVGKKELKLRFGGAFWAFFGGAFWAFVVGFLLFFLVLAQRENTVIYNILMPSA